MILKKNFKLWLYFNLRKLIQNDPYLKVLNNDAVLGEFKGVILNSRSLEELKSKLKKTQANNGFRFLRSIQEDKRYYFYHPSMEFQVDSLVNCWLEIKQAEKRIRKKHGLSSRLKGAAGLLLEQEEGLSEQIEKTSLFGLRPNMYCFMGIEDEKRATINDYELSKITTIKSEFKNEYEAFKQKIKAITKESLGENHSGIFFQTDIKKFYHSIKPEEASRFLRRYYRSLQSLPYYLDRLSEEGEDELPIGWILSSTVAYLIMVKFYEHYSKLVESKSFKLKLKEMGIKNLRCVSYVDDFVFTARTEPEFKKNGGREKLKCLILDTCEYVFHKKLKLKGVCFHRDINSNKNKFFDITPAFAEIVESNFFELVTNHSVIEDDDSFDLFDELMLPGDNGLIINEKVQFLKSIKTGKKRVEELARSKTRFNQTFKKILYKIESDGAKYIQSVISFLRVYFTEVESQGREVTEERYKDVVGKVAKSVFSSGVVTLDTMIKLVNSVQNLTMSIGPCPHSLMISLLDLCKEHIQENQEHFTSHDIDLFDTISEKIRIDLMTKGLSSGDFRTAKVEKEGVLPAFRSYKKLADYTSMFLGRRFSRIEINEHDVFLVIQAMQLASNSEHLTRADVYNDFLELIWEKSNFSRKIFRNIVTESAFTFFGTLTKNGQKRLLNILKRSHSSDWKVFYEIKWQVENIEKTQALINLHSNKKLRLYRQTVENLCDGRRGTDALDEYLYYSIEYKNSYFLIRKIILYSHLISCPDIASFWRALFFRYTKIDSAFNLSWKGVSSLFSPASIGVASTLKQVLNRGRYRKVSIIKKGILRSLEERPIVYSEGKSPVLKVDFTRFLEKFNISADFLESDEAVQVTIASLPLDPEKDFVPEEALSLNKQTRNRLHSRILKALKHAHEEGSQVIVFPELSLPRKFLNHYLSEAGKRGILLIGGLEYISDSFNRARNEIVVSLPTNKAISATGKSYWAITQKKVYPSTQEYVKLKNKFKFDNGKELIVFKSEKWKSFSVLNCVDFLSLKLKRLLQGHIQTLFVPALNYDSSTFYHLSQSCVRELYSYCVICNSKMMGGSSVYGPFRSIKDRNVLVREGAFKPDFATVEIFPSSIKNVQNESYKTLFRDSSTDLKRFKQLPPGWRRWD